MSLISRIFGSRTERRSGPWSSWDLLQSSQYGFSAGITTDSGVATSPYLAENLSAVFACVQVIAESVASLPIHLYRRVSEGVKVDDTNHPVAQLLQRGPNKIQTTPEFIEMMLGHVLLRGNSFSEIKWDDSGAPYELIPYHPDQVTTWRIPKTRNIVYDVFDLDGRRRRLLPEEMLHLRDRSDNGIIGRSRLQRAREALGTAIAIEAHAASTFRNGVRLSGVLSHPGNLSKDGHQHLKDTFADSFAGTANSGGTPILEEGLKWQSISVAPEDAELLASRKFGVETIARIYRVPLPMLGDLSNGSYNNVVELNRMFATHCLVPWIVRLEKVLERDLLSEDGKRTHCIEIDTDDLLRGDMLARWQAYRIMREIGGANANEIRAWEKINRRTDPGGDEFFAPLNMTSEQTGKPKDATNN